jgi:predicted pyridoxine 5'-phosphate oxidase superfamily flavin-nucleotide-binding protein
MSHLKEHPGEHPTGHLGEDPTGHLGEGPREHPGEIAVQRRAGVRRADWGSAGIGPEIPPVASDFLREQRMIIVGFADDAGAVWATAATGPAGFAAATGDRIVAVDALPVAFADLVAGGRDVGLLAIEPWTRRRMRVNGTAHRDGSGFAVRTDQVYANCPKYIQTRDIVADQPVAASASARTSTELDARQRDRIARADTFFVATYAAGHGADASHRGGNPGFVTVSSPRRLVWPDYVGNSMYMTLGNLELDPACGLLFVDWEHGHALHVTGTARVDWDPARAAAVPGAQRLIEFDVTQVVDLPGALPLRWRFGEYHRFNPRNDT